MQQLNLQEVNEVSGAVGPVGVVIGAIGGGISGGISGGFSGALKGAAIGAASGFLGGWPVHCGMPDTKQHQQAWDHTLYYSRLWPDTQTRNDL